MTRPFIPQRTDELTPEWLTAVLKERGWLKSARVLSAESEILGDGVGFLGVICRLTLELDRDEPTAPRTVIAKLPTAARANRVMAELIGAYRREILFYEQLATRVPTRTPGVYYAAFDDDPNREREEQRAAALDQLPLWMMRGIMVWARFVTGRRRNRYVLLVEDLTGRIGDQVAGGTPEDCRHVLEAMAETHAAFWESPSLSEYSWLARQELNPRMRQTLYRHGCRAFRERHPKLLSDGLGVLLDWLDEHTAELLLALHCGAPETLIHCDLRFDNVCFTGETPPVTVFDWQLVGVGAAAYDVAYLLTGALREDESAETEQALLRSYHSHLVQLGIRGYAFERFVEDYHRGLLAVLTIVASTDSMDMGEDRGVALMDAWARRSFARLRDVDPTQLC